MSNQYLTFDVTKANQVQQLIVGRQGDNALKSVSMLFWDGEKNRPYDLTGKQVYFEALKPDNSHIVDYAGVTITDPKYGLATYAFNEQVFTVQGMMQQAFFKISETDSNGNVTTDSSLEVSINVLSNIVEFGIKSEDYLSEYDRLVADVEKKFDDYANTVSGNIADVAKAHDDIQALIQQISDKNIVTLNEFNVTKGVAQTALDEERALTARYNTQEDDLINSMNAKISQISSVPETFANLSALQSTYPNGKTGLFVTADTGHKFIWANGSWSDAGIYQSVGIADGSLAPTKLTRSAQNNGISEGVYFPLVKSNIINNALANSSSIPDHLSLPLNISVSTSDTDKVYLLLQIFHDSINNKYGATFGYAPKLSDNSFDANKVVSYNYNSFSNTEPTIDQYGHVTQKYVFGSTAFTITYNVPKLGQSKALYFANLNAKSYFDSCIIDPSVYSYNIKLRGMDNNYDVNYPLVAYKVPGNTLTDSTPLAEHRRVLRDIKIINPEPNTSYLILGIYNNTTNNQYGVQFAKSDRIDGLSFDMSTVRIINDISKLSTSPLPVDSDGNTNYTFSYGNTVISATYNIGDMGTFYGSTRLAYVDGTKYYDIALINESTFISLPKLINAKRYNKPTWLGDSITEINSKASIHYHEIIANAWGSTASTNLGISGSTIGNISNPMSVRYTQIPADTDFISVFGGVNDYGRNQPLGQYGDTTNDTFYGALYVLLNGLQTQFPTVPKIFISPMHIGSSFGGDFTSTVNGLGLTQDVYEQAIVEMTRKFGIPHLSLFSDMGVTFAVKAQSDYYSADSLHPNDAGQTLIADKVLNFLN